MIGNVIILSIWLALIPLCIGCIPLLFMHSRKRSIPFAYVAGLLIMFMMFQIIAVPIILGSGDFNKVVFIYKTTCYLLIPFGIFCGVISYMQLRRRRTSVAEKRNDLFTLVLWFLFFALLGLQLYQSLALAFPDGDAAFYTTTALEAQSNNTMYRRNVYTGDGADLNIRYCLAPLPIWIAFLGRVSNTHATIVANTFMPVSFILATYAIYYEIGKKLYIKRKEDIGLFMVIISLLHIFGNYSIYTNATFLLTRSSQGKALLANFVIASLFLLLYHIIESPKDKGLWLLLLATSFTGALCSTLGVFLVSMLVGLTAVFWSIYKKNIRILIKPALCCIPGIIYALLYFVIS